MKFLILAAALFAVASGHGNLGQFLIGPSGYSRSVVQHRSVDVCQSEGAQRLMTNLPTAIEECGEPTTHTFAADLHYVNCAMVKLEIGEDCEQGPMSECGLADAAAKAAALCIPFNASNMDA